MLIPAKVFRWIIAFVMIQTSQFSAVADESTDALFENHIRPVLVQTATLANPVRCELIRRPR